MVARNKSRYGKDQPNATLITKQQASGSAKIDPLMAASYAVASMSTNPWSTPPSIFVIQCALRHQQVYYYIEANRDHSRGLRDRRPHRRHDPSGSEKPDEFVSGAALRANNLDDRSSSSIAWTKHPARRSATWAAAHSRKARERQG